MSIKDCFVPCLDLWLEADYSQLEIRVLAELSGDSVLKADVAVGDLHRQRAAAWLHKPEASVTAEERRKAKQISFQLSYGAGAKSISEKMSIPKREAQSFIDFYADRYADVIGYQQSVMNEAISNRTRSARHSATGRPIGNARLQCPITNKIYTFWEKDNWKGDAVNFYAPETQNYPVQGTAAVIVNTALGRLFRALMEGEYKSYVANTVHDSFLIDTDTEESYGVQRLAKQVMEDVPRYIKEDYDYTWTTPLPVDFKHGDSWGSMVDIED